ncbi:hypothetical protein BHM03_00046526, partial [Ensete ventricosum]
MDGRRYLGVGFSYRSVPPISSGTYQSAKLPVRGPPAIGRYRQNRPSVVDFGHWRPIEGEIDRRWSIEGEKGKKKKRKRRKKKKRRRRIPCAVLARTPLPPVSRRHSQVARGRFFSHAGRKIEAIKTLKAHGQGAVPRPTNRSRTLEVWRNSYVELTRAMKYFRAGIEIPYHISVSSFARY